MLKVYIEDGIDRLHNAYIVHESIHSQYLKIFIIYKIII